MSTATPAFSDRCDGDAGVVGVGVGRGGGGAAAMVVVVALMVVVAVVGVEVGVLRPCSTSYTCVPFV